MAGSAPMAQGAAAEAADMMRPLEVVEPHEGLEAAIMEVEMPYATSGLLDQHTAVSVQERPRCLLPFDARLDHHADVFTIKFDAVEVGVCIVGLQVNGRWRRRTILHRCEGDDTRAEVLL